MSLNIIKGKKAGKIVYSIRNEKGKHVKYLGTAERILKVFEGSQTDSEEDPKD